MADEITPHGESQEQETTDWKAEARKWEQRAKDNLAASKANESAAQRLAELEGAQKSGEAETSERIASLEAALAASTREALVARIAGVHGVSAEDAGLFLTGADEETLTAQAARLAERTKHQGNVARKEGDAITSGRGDDGMRETVRQLFRPND